jgi:ATP-dependent DNA ligase
MRPIFQWLDENEEEYWPQRLVSFGWPGRASLFVPLQLSQPVEKPPPSAPHWVHEIKLDGFHMAVRIDDGRVQRLTRTGLDWTAKYRGAVAALASISAKTAISTANSTALRMALLEPLVANKPGLQFNGHDAGDGELILKHAVKLGFEGVVSKTIDAALCTRKPRPVAQSQVLMSAGDSTTTP